MNKPELVYNFMQLANHNAVWNSKKGAAMGFSAIANLASEDLTKNLSAIVPKLYRYQFDSTPSIQMGMARIWQKIVPSTSKVVSEYKNKKRFDFLSIDYNPWPQSDPGLQLCFLS